MLYHWHDNKAIALVLGFISYKIYIPVKVIGLLVSLTIKEREKHTCFWKDNIVASTIYYNMTKCDVEAKLLGTIPIKY